MDDIESRIDNLNTFLALVDEWTTTHSAECRAKINRSKRSIEREVVEAGCMQTITISPPPAIGGMIMQNVNPFDMIFDQVYLRSLNSYVKDMINQTIGVLEDRKNNPPKISSEQDQPQLNFQMQKKLCFCCNAYWAIKSF